MSSGQLVHFQKFTTIFCWVMALWKGMIWRGCCQRFAICNLQTRVNEPIGDWQRHDNHRFSYMTQNPPSMILIVFMLR